MKKTTITANGKEKVVYNYSPEILYSLYDTSFREITENEDEQDLWIDACEIYTNADRFTPENYIAVLEEHEPDERVDRYKELHALKNPTEEECAEEHDLWDYIVERAEFYPETMVKTLGETILVEWEDILPEGTEKAPELARGYDKIEFLHQSDGCWYIYKKHSKGGKHLLVKRYTESDLELVYSRFALDIDDNGKLIPSFTEDDLIDELEGKDISFEEAQEVAEELVDEVWKLISEQERADLTICHNLIEKEPWEKVSSIFRCSVCGNEIQDTTPLYDSGDNKFNYCPNCGRKIVK